jgi:hypothetical protein
MAGGNMGDLSFSLTLKSRIEEETKKITKELNKIDATGKQAQNALEAISEATKGIGDNGGKGFKKLNDFVKELRHNISVFSSEDFFSPKKLQQLESVESGLYRIGRILGEVSKEGAGFNIFPNSVATEANKAERELYKLSSFIAEINKRHGEGIQIFGVDSTNNIRQSLSELSKYRTELEQIRNNGGIHPVSGLTASDVVKSAGFLNAKDEAKAYAKEIKQALKEADAAKKTSIEEEKKNEQIVENILQRRAQERQRVAEKEAEIERQRQEQAKISAQIAQENANSEIKWNEQKAKAFSEALQRQMKASVEAEKKRQVSLFSNGFDTTILEKRIAMLNRMKEIQDKLAYYHPKAQYAFLNYESGLKFGNANTPEMRHKEDELQRLRNIIADLESEFNKLGGNEAFKNVDNQIKNLEQTIARLKESGGSLNLGKMLGLENKSTDEFRIAKEAAMATEAHVKRQNELTAAFEKYFNVQKQVEDAEKRLAEATARTNQARREAIAASRQQAESLVRDRVKELEAQRQQLQGLFGSGKNVLSTQELIQLQQAFSQITQELNTLRSAMNNLGSYSIKDLFSIGRGTSDYAPLINSMLTVIDQKQEAINLERKHQEEITRTAAKARNDLAAAFAGANAEAKKMQSAIGDIKSLFLQGGIVFGAQQFFNSIVQTGGEIVQQHVALRSILGDVQKADELFAQTQQLALQSPFKFGELNRDVKQLAAFGVEANDLYDTTKRLADIASGLGVDFSRLGLAFGQVKARSWLDGKELRQFAYAGLPLLKRITELYNSEGKNGRSNYTQADVKKMISARQVSFEDVQKVLWKMTDEGGQFYNMQLVLSETLLGRWNKLIDAWDIMLGRFAEGKNVVGGTFSFIINRVTDLVLALDKLSPALLSFGAVFAARKLGGMAYSKMGVGSLAKSYTQQMNAQLKSYAIEQQQLVVEGEITQKIAQQNVFKRAAILSEKQSLAASYNRAALEGRMSVLQMQRAVKEGLVSKEIIRQLALMGQITAKQEQIILNGGRMSAVWSMTTSKIGGFFNAIGGWWGIGITAVTSLLMGYYQWSSRVKEEEKTLIDGVKQKSKSYRDFLSELGPKDASNLSSKVDSMKEILKSSDDYTDSIKKQVESAGSLSEQYDILKGKIEDAKKANDVLADKYGVITNNATSATGLASDNLFDMIGSDTPQWLQWLNGLTNDDIAKNVEQAQESLSKFQVMFDELDSSTKAKMEDFIRSLMENNEELANQIKGLPLTEQISMLASIGGDDWEKFVDKFANGSKETEDWLKELAERANDSFDDVYEIMYDDVPRGLESVRKQLGLSQDQFRTWAKRNPEIFASMMDKMAQKANITSKTILYYFHSAISELMDMDFWPGDSGNGKQGKPSYNSGVNTPFSEIIRKRLHKNGTFTGNKKKGKFWAREVDNALRQVQDQSFETTGENIRKELKAARNELDTIVNGKVSKNSSEYKNAKHKYDLWKAIANAGYISDDFGKNKVTGHFGKGKNKNGREEDKQLKNLRERIGLYKKMYSEIKKFKELYGKGALGQLANDGEFKVIFGDKKRFPISDYTNYETSIKELLRTLPASTKDRLDYAANEKAGIQTENRKLLEDQRRDELNVLNKQLDTISEQYETYKKIYELTGNKKGSENIAFGGTVQFDTYKRFLEEQLDIAVKHDNVQSGLNLTMDEVKGMSLENVKDKYGEETRVYDIRKKLEDENNKIKKETIDLMASLIEKNATIAQQIEDENRKYERQLELINGIEDPQMRDRAKAGATKTHSENVAKLQFEQFKQESDWVAIFDDLDRVSSATINSMIEKIDQFSMTTGLSVESIKQLRDALDKLRNEQISRNPFPSVFGGVKRGNAIGKFINERLGGMGDTAKIFVSKEEASKLGIAGGVRTKASLKNDQQSAYADSSKAISELATKMQALNTVLDPVINLFKAMGEEDSILGQIVGGASGALSSAASTAGAIGTLSKMKGFEFLEGAGPYGAAAAAALSVGSSLIKAFGADYSSYNKAKAEYDNLSSIWDSLISKKTEYMNIHWGTEATEASKEAQEMLKAEIEQTKVIAQKRLNSGSSAGSHSIWYRMWKGSYGYNGQNWRDVAGEISSKYGVQFNGMEDMLNMNADTLSKIKKDYTGLWANMDSDFRDYLEKLIQYGEKADDMIDAVTEKLTGNKFSDLVSSWGDAMATMANSSDNLVDHFEENLKKVILNSMIENLYGDRIKAVLKKTEDYAKNGEVAPVGTPDKPSSQYTDREMSDIMSDVDSLAKDIEAQRDWFKSYYNWSDNSSSSSRNSVKNITEETADILVSYCNSMRADLAMVRESQAKFIPEMNEIAKSQLTQLNAIAQNTLRNADAAERIESIFVEYNDNFNRVLNGTKSLKMK